MKRKNIKKWKLRQKRAIDVVVKTMLQHDVKMKNRFLVGFLTSFATDKDLKDSTIYIPDGCEKYGFVEGYFNVGEYLYFIADMFEE